mgnify:CR=1 FL=1
MSNQKLIEYVNRARQEGLNEEQIKQNLRQAGWNEVEINDSFIKIPYLSKDFPATNKILSVFKIIGILVMSLVASLGYILLADESMAIRRYYGISEGSYMIFGIIVLVLIFSFAMYFARKVSCHKSLITKLTSFFMVGLFYGLIFYAVLAVLIGITINMHLGKVTKITAPYFLPTLIISSLFLIIIGYFLNDKSSKKFINILTIVNFIIVLLIMIIGFIRMIPVG